MQVSTLQTRPLCYLEASSTIHPVMQCNFTEEWRPQLQSCESLETSINVFLFKTATNEM